MLHFSAPFAHGGQVKLPTARPQDAADFLTKPPRGMWYEHRPSAPSPFLARWRRSDGKKACESFDDEKARAKFAAQWVTQREKFERVDTSKLALVWEEFRTIVGDVHPLQVAREWREWRGIGDDAMTVAKAVETYLAFRFAGKLSPDTKRHFDKHLKERFAGAYAARKLRDVNAELISEWLDGLKNPRTGEPMEALTKRHHRKDLNTFLDYCSRVRGWIPRNPCEAVAVPSVEEEDVALLTVEEGRALFAAAEKTRIAARLAMEAFGFMRASSAGRAQRDDIRFDSRGVRMPGAQHKSQKAKFRQGHPDVLWAWLNRAPDECWAMQWWEYRNEKAAVFRVAGVGGSENRLRKTCISAHLAWLKNPPLTSYLAQHRHSSTTEIYHGVMEEDAGRAWFQLGPRFMA